MFSISEILSLFGYSLILLSVVFFVLSFYWVPIFKFFNLKKYNNIQRVHLNEIPRFGGFVIYCFLCGLFFFNYIKEPFVSNLLISSAPFIFVSFKEDLFHNTSPKLRLISMLISCLIFFYINPIEFPAIDIPFVGDLIAFYPVGIIFFTFSIMVVMNGMNLIDGMNGLFSFTALFQLFTIGFLAYNYKDTEMLYIVQIFSIPLLLFLFFNFPFGKIFAGDLGAYFFGFVNGLLIIYFFGKHPNLLTWLAVLILFYPCAELLFSYYRKLKNKLSPFHPDNKHLHTLINKRIYKKLKNKTFANSLSTLSLLLFWLLPFLIIINIHQNTFLIFFCLIIFSYIYIYLYKLIDKRLRKTL